MGKIGSTAVIARLANRELQSQEWRRHNVQSGLCPALRLSSAYSSWSPRVNTAMVLSACSARRTLQPSSRISNSSYTVCQPASLQFMLTMIMHASLIQYDNCMDPPSRVAGLEPRSTLHAVDACQPPNPHACTLNKGSTATQSLQACRLGP